MDRDPGRATAQRAFLEKILEVLPVHAVANHHGALLAHVQRTGGTRGAHDLVIARTDRSTHRAHHRRARPLSGAGLVLVTVQILGQRRAHQRGEVAGGSGLYCGLGTPIQWSRKADLALTGLRP